ncbi:predicted protein [Histoplasma mississippiense (nom. inval.)]|uniref:predicted protein n=1 Tax=Ajellomyces capsulatus (strain NAm1 / WU24) TaxID=2059318 RepID=UPI000157D2F9|nr:predicted protein [Histoplasma mississippiense (nom. inval.)]EDN04901.1 predicted protein [Histoplasma mississippiense (nom. inval.)]
MCFAKSRQYSGPYDATNALRHFHGHAWPLSLKSWLQEVTSPTSKPRPNHTWFLPLPGHQGVRLPPSEAETMGNKNPPDERVVYLALKNIFKGPSAEAKIRFPEVFDVSPVQSAEREASEAEAARNEANAIKDAVHGPQEHARDVIQVRRAVETGRDNKPSTLKKSRHIPSLFPIYLPLRSQHLLLAKVQTILEQTCFEFGQHVMPDVLQKNHWDCPESADLNVWATELLPRQDVFADNKGYVGKPLEKLFRSVADIRHTAVHRIHTFGGTRSRRLRSWSATSTSLGSKLDETLKRIARSAGKELDRVEQSAITEMVKEDGEYQVLAGSNLEQAIASSEAMALTAAVTGNETSSDMDDVDSVEDCRVSGLAGYSMQTDM